MNSPGQNTGVGSLSLLQGIFPTQGSNPGIPHGSGKPIPSLADLPDQEIKLGSPAWQADSLPADLSGKPRKSVIRLKRYFTMIFPYTILFYFKNSLKFYN